MNFWLLLGVTGADLTDADLRGADFSLANVAKVSPLYPKEVQNFAVAGIIFS